MLLITISCVVTFWVLQSRMTRLREGMQSVKGELVTMIGGGKRFPAKWYGQATNPFAKGVTTGAPGAEPGAEAGRGGPNAGRAGAEPGVGGEGADAGERGGTGGEGSGPGGGFFGGAGDAGFGGPGGASERGFGEGTGAAAASRGKKEGSLFGRGGEEGGERVDATEESERRARVAQETTSEGERAIRERGAGKAATAKEGEPEVTDRRAKIESEEEKREQKGRFALDWATLLKLVLVVVIIIILTVLLLGSLKGRGRQR